ncbi:paeninodin family lasso peptide [Paenibacillus sp. GCM10027628]
MENQTKLEWQQPTLEVLDVTQTMGGPNGRVPDKNGKGSNNRS